MGIFLNHLENNGQVIQENLLESDDYYSKMEVLMIDAKLIYAKAGR